MADKTPSIVKCTLCDKKTTGAKAMQNHLRDVHHLTGRAAHMIANPNDKQAERKLGHSRRWPSPLTRPARQVDDFDPIDDGDQFEG